MYRPKIDRRKFRNLMLYLAYLSSEDPYFGAVKLNKMLYYCDFIAFSRLGKPITGATYQKLPEGPAPRQLLDERNVLIEQEEARLELRPHFAYMQHRLVPIPEDQSHLEAEFSAEEIGVITEVHSAMSQMTASDASELSHREVGWILANPREDIPYEMASAVPVRDVEVDAMFEAVNGSTHR